MHSLGIFHNSSGNNTAFRFQQIEHLTLPPLHRRYSPKLSLHSSKTRKEKLAANLQVLEVQENQLLQ